MSTNFQYNSFIQNILIDRYYYISLSIITCWSTYFHWNVALMSGILPYYLEFTEYIHNGFTFYKPFTSNIYTWPMWGYGFILLLGNKFLILLLQQSLTFCIAVAMREKLRFYSSPYAFKIFSFLLLFSFSLFFFHTNLWPYSLASNFLILSLHSLSNYLKRGSNISLVFSALFYGIMLNMRSDYMYLIIIIFILSSVLLYCQNKRPAQFIDFIFWPILILCTMIPWSLYTKKYSSKISFVSSNSGHVLYISLGQLPNNRWGITPFDGDSSMYQLLRKSDSSIESSLTFKSNEILINGFKNIVLTDTKEYIKKCLFNFKSILLMPFYVGDLSAIIEGKDSLTIKRNFKEALGEWDLKKVIYVVIDLLRKDLIKITALLASYIVGIVIFYGFIYTSIRYIYISIRIKKSDYISVLIIVIFLYQISLNTLAYNMPLYTTNIYLLLLYFIGKNTGLKRCK